MRERRGRAAARASWLWRSLQQSNDQSIETTKPAWCGVVGYPQGYPMTRDATPYPVALPTTPCFCYPMGNLSMLSVIVFSYYLLCAQLE